nr:MAG TPA: hypothetical protein [Caudoviricetes sp.]
MSITPVRGDHFKIIIIGNIFPKRNEINANIKFEYWDEESNVTLTENVIYMSGSIKERTDKAIEHITTIVESSSLVDETGKNPSTFINDTLNDLYDKAVKLRDDFIDGEDYTEHSMITITVNTEKLEDRGLLDEQ